MLGAQTNVSHQDKLEFTLPQTTAVGERIYSLEPYKALSTIFFFFLIETTIVDDK